MGGRLCLLRPPGFCEPFLAMVYTGFSGSPVFVLDGAMTERCYFMGLMPPGAIATFLIILLYWPVFFSEPM